MMCEDRVLSGQQFVDRIAALSNVLSAQFGVRPGDVVMVASLNTDRMMEALLAGFDAGAVVSPANFRWGSAELASAMDLTRPRVVLADEHCWPLVQAGLAYASEHMGVAPASMQLVHLGPPPSSRNDTASAKLLPSSEDLITAQLSRATAPPPTLQLLMPPCGTALLCFTSGTTGRPKGAMLSHAAFYAQTMCKLALVGYGPTDTFLLMAPLFHIGGLSSAMACVTGTRVCV